MSEAVKPKTVLRVVGGRPARTDQSTTDAELISGVRALEPGTARRMYRRLLPVVDRTLLRVFGVREQDHDDLVQISFEQIFESIIKGRFLGNCALTTWASTIAARVGLAELRKRYVRRSVYAESSNSEAETLRASHRRQHALDEIDVVRRALASLPEDRAWLLFLHDVEGHELKDIATQVGATVSATQSRVLRARRRFLERFEQLDAEAREISRAAEEEP